MSAWFELHIVESEIKTNTGIPIRTFLDVFLKKKNLSLYTYNQMKNLKPIEERNLKNNKYKLSPTTSKNLTTLIKIA